MPRVAARTKLEDGRELASALLADFDKGLSVTRIARKCEHLGRLMNDPFIQAYVDKCMNWDEHQDVQSLLDWLRRVGRTDEASGVVQFLEDFKLQGPSIAGYLLGPESRFEFGFMSKSLPAAETFIQSARKSAKYTAEHTDFLKSIEQAERVVDRVSTRLHRYVSNADLRLRFGSIPESILEATRRRVDRALTGKCPAAIEKFAVAYEELAGKSPENWTNACTAVRRVLLDFADAVYPPRSEPINGRRVGPADYINRLWAFAQEKIPAGRSRGVLLAELNDLGARIDAVYDLSNKGMHDSVTKDEADRIVIRTYLLLADLLAL